MRVEAAKLVVTFRPFVPQSVLTHLIVPLITRQPHLAVGTLVLSNISQIEIFLQNINLIAGLIVSVTSISMN